MQIVQGNSGDTNHGKNMPLYTLIVTEALGIILSSILDKHELVALFNLMDAVKTEELVLVVVLVF